MIIYMKQTLDFMALKMSVASINKILTEGKAELKEVNGKQYFKLTI